MLKSKDFEGDFVSGSIINCIFRVSCLVTYRFGMGVLFREITSVSLLRMVSIFSEFFLSSDGAATVAFYFLISESYSINWRG